MFTLIIRERSGEERRELFEEQEVLVGRVPGNDLVLRAGNVSRQHARFAYRNTRLLVSDLGSANGTYVNGRKIRQPTILRDGDEVWIGDFYLRVEISSPASMQAVAAPAPAHPVVMTQWYVYREGGDTVGPVGTDQLCAGIRAGKVPLDSYVCAVGSHQWQPMDHVPDLAGAVRTVAEQAAQARQPAPATEMPSQLATDVGPEALWYVVSEGSDPFGPITTEQLRRAIRSGQVSITSQVNRAGSPDWFDLAVMPDFYEEVLRFGR
ncbi:MAG TPA: GYF domain-containing protein [Polyangiaceae bacterium]|jgi:hypothetical protein|nr:MAG: Glycogen accumulation regulator GarA [Deltaproteobacteria bacterium ADurb.Bin207]HNS99999.1 GYF domain-containing protein [Polyangiaceae bacterium]HNZ23864.1 GYF domain-containing protein [Polyangiaceae bacterium]HOD22343.1 GYF domain-containing protein [Polyangiaceae bacterium]HOE50244.1 GYF domain-containing protein [Polyangiaceae bacterium]